MNTLGILIALSLCVLGVVAKAQKTVAEVIHPYSYDTRTFAFDDSTEVAYIDEGAGERTLIMIHGLATYLPSWYPVFDYLRAKHRCIAVDLPGYGRSAKPIHPATMTYYAKILNALIDELQIKKPVLIGHSMGAQIAITAVLTNPDRFTELILLAPAGFETFTEQHVTWLKTVTTADAICGATPEQIRANWRLNFFRMPESVEFMIEDRLRMKDASDFSSYGRAVAGSVSGMLDQPVFNLLDELKTRTLVVYGANDALIPNKYLHPDLTIQMVAEAGAHQIANATLKFIPECGHFITYDQPGAINEIIDSFLMD